MVLVVVRRHSEAQAGPGTTSMFTAPRVSRHPVPDIMLTAGMEWNHEAECAGTQTGVRISRGTV